MKNVNQSTKYVTFGIMIFVLILGAFVAMPARTQAFKIGQLIDPLCLFACDKEPEIAQLIDPLCLFACKDESNNNNENAQVQNPTVNISASPLSVNYNESSTVYWNSNNSTSCNASGGTNGWSGYKSTSGTFYTGTLTNTTTYYITCSNSTGSVNDSVTVNVNAQVQNPTVNISANPLNVSYNGSSTISWNTNNATSCFASGGSNGWAGNKSISGIFYTSALTNTTTYYINCSNSTGSVNDSVTINVDNQQTLQPTVTISADNTRIDSGDETRIRWSSDNATRCDTNDGANGWSDNNVGTHGIFDTGSLERDETYRITCENSHGDTDTDSVTVRVDDNNNNEPDVTTRNATNISTGSATLNGQVDGNGSTVRAWFEYGTNTNFGYSTSQNSYNSGSTNYNRSISGLIPNTTYYFRAVAENSQDTVYGSILSFNTVGNVVNPINNQPTVVIYADQTNIAYNAATIVRWNTTNATSCFASGGSVGWAGAKNIGSGFSYTGLLTSSRTYTITCSNSVGSSTDSVTVNVRGQVLGTTITRPVTTPAPTSFVLVTSSINNNQSIMPTLDNTRPRGGDEINYTVSYQNIGTGAITSLILQINLPQEVNYMFSNGSNPSIFGNTFIFNLGTLKANGQGTVTVRVKVQNNVSSGTNLNFPATLSYIDPSGQPQSVNANVSAQVLSEPIAPTVTENVVPIGANVFGAGFLPTNIFGWLLLLVLILLLILIAKYLFISDQPFPFRKQTITTFDQPSLGKETTTTTIV